MSLLNPNFLIKNIKYILDLKMEEIIRFVERQINRIITKYEK